VRKSISFTSGSTYDKGIQQGWAKILLAPLEKIPDKIKAAQLGRETRLF